MATNTISKAEFLALKEEVAELRALLSIPKVKATLEDFKKKQGDATRPNPPEDLGA
eukprot:c31169_g1_i1 orf=99-266(-)